MHIWFFYLIQQRMLLMNNGEKVRENKILKNTRRNAVQKWALKPAGEGGKVDSAAYHTPLEDVTRGVSLLQVRGTENW